MIAVQLLTLLLVLCVIKGFFNIRSRFFSYTVSFFLALLFTVQLSSVVVTGEIADYRFYENFNISDALSVAGFFGKEGILIAVALIGCTLLIYYSGRLIQKKLKKRAVTLVMLLLGIGILSLPGGIVNNLYYTGSLKFAGDATFDEALASLQIDRSDYVEKDNIKASKGKNIIVLSLESLEKGYLNEKLAHLTPNLRRLAKKHTFYDMRQAPAGGWTSASMYIAVTGVPAFFGTHGNRVFQNSYENKLTTLADVLKEADYSLEYFIGKKEFSGIDDMLRSLGFTVKSEKDFETKYQKVDWGIQDKDLFEEFKKELSLKNDANRPFALFLSTIGTHFPNGVPDQRIDSLLPPQKSRLELMVSATDYFIGNLISFLEKESMLSDTVFYIYPDHLLMGTKSRVVEDFDERSLYLLTNATPNETGYPEDRPINQIDLAKIIVQGAEISTNAKFLTDFITDGDKNNFLGENTQNLLRLNEAALKTLNCKDGIYIVGDTEQDTLEIKNREGQVALTASLPQKGNCQRILFDKNYRPYRAIEIAASKSAEASEAFAHVDIFTTNGLLYGSLKQEHNFGLTKNGKQEVVFDESDLSLLGGIDLEEDLRRYMTVTSNSWNAQKPASFNIKGRTEQLSRGLTLIHFNGPDSYEFRTFDTYGNEKDAKAITEILLKLKNTDAPYVLLSSDSASRNLAPFTAALNDAGFKKLSMLKDRQAYLAHNLRGSLVEFSNDTSVSKELLFPKNINPTKALLSEPKIDFEPAINRYIAHAGGNISGLNYTNSKNALDYSYAQGFRMFELDIIETSDGHFVAAHDWNHWAKETGYAGTVPVNLSEFKKHKIRGNYTTMDMEAINEWFRTHPDATLVTDKVNDPVRFANGFIDKKRLVMELFSLDAVKRAVEQGITPILSEKGLGQIKEDKIEFLTENGIQYVGMSRRAVSGKKEFLKKLRENDIKVYVYHVNFDSGKDEKYVLNNEIGLVYGMYADTWLPEFMPKTNNR